MSRILRMFGRGRDHTREEFSEGPDLVDEFTTEIIPGTMELVDIGNHAKDKQHKGKEIVLVPQPSSDPNDPLNWTQWRKVKFMAFALAGTFFIASVTSIIGILMPGLSAAGVSETAVNRGSAYCFLLLGWMNIVFQPLAMARGRRLIVIFGLLVSVVACPLWMAYVKTDGNYYASRIVQGIFGSPFESLIEILVADVFFVHERAFWMASYVVALSGGSFLGPIASAFVFSNMGYRWVLYFHAIFAGGLAVLMFFLMEESGYHRKPSVIHALNSADESTGNPGIIDSGIMSKDQLEGQDPEKYNVQQIQTASGDSGSAYRDSEMPDIPRMHPYWYRLRLYSKVKPIPSLARVVRPVVMLYKFPHILWAGFMVASSLSGFQILTGTISSVLMAPPYNFSENSVGLAYIGPTVSTIFVCIYSGPLSDWHVLWLARRRGGIHEAEDRIWLGLICILLLPFGYFLYGIGAYHHVHWFGVIFGISVTAAGMGISSSIPYTYALDACSELGSEAIVAIVLMRNTISFAFTFSITPWINSQGLQNTFITIGFILGVAFWITGIPMLLYGKRLRVKSKDTYFRWAAEAADH